MKTIPLFSSLEADGQAVHQLSFTNELFILQSGVGYHRKFYSQTVRLTSLHFGLTCVSTRSGLMT